MEVFSQLGIDWKLLIAQMVNIVILLALLYKFLYKPVLKALDDRQKMVTDSVHKADEIATRLKVTEKEQHDLLAKAREQAQEIVAQARDVAKAQTEEAVTRTRAEVENVVRQAKVHIEAEKQKMLADASSQLADVVVVATKKIMGEVADEKMERLLAQKAVDALKDVNV
ncbi:MAG: F0F1 ATP synthase subunit B [bacterium]|nr:F0F1 ATP synthase subunit B [bacterium]